MPGLNSVSALVACYERGASIVSSWRKAPAVVTARGYWLDLAMSPGNPRPIYYASSPYMSVALAQSTDGGIFHGGAVAPATKHLHTLMAMTQTAGAVPLPMMLCDYLLYYPFIDESLVGEEQVLIQSATLPRYPDGIGVQMMAVVTAPHAGSPVTNLQVRYTNSSGVAGRVTPVVRMNTAQFVNGTILTSHPALVGTTGPFLPLQEGDVGVRSVQGVTIVSGGEVGLFTLVLVKPLADLSLRGIDAPVEVDYCIDRPSMPRVMDDACLNLLAHSAGSVTGAQINGLATFIWS